MFVFIYQYSYIAVIRYKFTLLIHEKRFMFYVFIF